MPTTKTPKAAAPAAPIIKENVLKGTLFSVGAVIVGVILWVALWRMGFIASIVAFAIAWLAIKLYGLGAGTVTRKSAPIIVAVSIVGVVLAFLGGMASDMADFLVEETGIALGDLVTEGNFWTMFWENITTNGELWKEYRNDLLISLGFAALGMFWLLKDLFVQPVVTSDNAKTDA